MLCRTCESSVTCETQPENTELSGVTYIDVSLNCIETQSRELLTLINLVPLFTNYQGFWKGVFCKMINEKKMESTAFGRVINSLASMLRSRQGSIQYIGVLYDAQYLNH